MRCVIDPAALVRLAADPRPPDATHQLVAPARVRSDAMDLLLGQVGTDGTSESEALVLVDRLAEIRVRALNDRVSRRTAWRLARERGWPTVRHAEYVAVGRLQADVLVTEDPALVEAAEGVVPVVPYDELFRR